MDSCRPGAVHLSTGPVAGTGYRGHHVPLRLPISTSTSKSSPFPTAFCNMLFNIHLDFYEFQLDMLDAGSRAVLVGWPRAAESHRSERPASFWSLPRFAGWRASLWSHKHI